MTESRSLSKKYWLFAISDEIDIDNLDVNFFLDQKEQQLKDQSVRALIQPLAAKLSLIDQNNDELKIKKEKISNVIYLSKSEDVVDNDEASNRTLDTKRRVPKIKDLVKF